MVKTLNQDSYSDKLEMENELDWEQFIIEEGDTLYRNDVSNISYLNFIDQE